jgi:hypothetical protein
MSTINKSKLCQGIDCQWGYSPTLDPNGDGIITSSEKGYIYTYKGPHKELSAAPLFKSSLHVFKTAVILICMTLAVLNIYNIFGCKSRYLQSTQPYQTQVVIFLVFLINIFIVSAENYRSTRRVVPTVLSMIMAGIALLMFNIMAKLGDTWAFFSVPFWPTPMTWWGLIMNIMMFIVVLDINKHYWLTRSKQMFGSTEKYNVDWYNNVESIAIVGILIAIATGFINQLYIQKKALKNKFRFLKFFFGTNAEDKELTKKSIYETSGHCKDAAFDKFDKEVKEGIKNSIWTKIKKYVKN